MSQRKVYEWVERFKSGRTRVTDESRSGRPSTSRTQDHIDRADAMLREDRRITVSEVAAHLDTSYGSAYAILRDDLGYRTVCARWVPKERTVVHNHCDPESKRQSMEWRHPSSPAQKKFKRQPSAKKVMLTLFWDMHGPNGYSGAFPSEWTNSEQC